MMFGERDYGGLLDLIYQTPLDPELWPRVLETFADAIGGDAAALLWQNQETGAGAGITARLDPLAPKLYFGDFATRNPLQRLDNPRAQMRNFIPRILTDEDRMPKEALVRTEYYNDFMRRFDMHSVVMIGLAVEGLEAGTINITRPSSHGQFNSCELNLTRRLHSHFIRAFTLGRKFSATRRLNEDLTAFLDRSPYGVFLLGEDGRVRHANSAAQRMIRGGHGLAAVSGRLHAAVAESGRRLEALIAAATSSEDGRRMGGSMALASPLRRRPFSVTVAPLRSERSAIFHGGPAVLVCVTDLEAGVSLPEETLRDLFGLSPAEARVARALFEGQSPKEAAAGLGLSFFTVRGHLVRIYEKTQTSGQVELARLMMRSIGVGSV